MDDDNIGDKLFNDLSYFFNLNTIEAKYLKYLLDIYEKNILNTYTKIYENRGIKLEILLNPKFEKLKLETDIEMDKANNILNQIDLYNISSEKLDDLSKQIQFIQENLDLAEKFIENENLPF